MKTSNFWADDYPRPADLTGSELPDKMDVVVVGGGYTGLHAAIALRKAGAPLLCWTRRHRLGASSRNGGMALTGMKMEMPAVFKRYGPELGRRFWAWSSASIDHLACTLAEEQIDCDFERSGHILLAAKPKHYTAMAHELEWMRSELGYEDAWLVSKDQQQAEIGTAAFFGGLADQRSGALHPAKYVFGLAQAAARRGAVLVERAGDRCGAAPGRLLGRHEPGHGGEQGTADCDEWLHVERRAGPTQRYLSDRQLHHRDRAAAGGVAGRDQPAAAHVFRQ